jgi:hypothetical protein
MTNTPALDIALLITAVKSFTFLPLLIILHVSLTIQKIITNFGHT